jgi:hypothetical protein
MNCPICNKPADRIYSDYMDGWCLMEEEYRCGNHYIYNYVTGYSSEFINGFEFVWGYNSPLNAFHKLRRKLIIEWSKIDING